MFDKRTKKAQYSSPEYQAIKSLGMGPFLTPGLKFEQGSDTSYLPSFESIGLSVQQKFKIHFQDDGHGSHLGFLIGRIVANFDL